jgi:acyl carrier protein
MNNPETISKVNNIMHKGFEIPFEKLIPEATIFGDLGLDSLDSVDMLVHLESNLNIKVDGERLMKVRTLQDIYNLAEELESKTGQ